MISVRHITASGALDGDNWQFRRRHVEATVRSGDVYIHLWIEVCSPDRPTFGAAPITRLNEETWLILPTRYERTWPGGVEVLTPSPCPIGDLLAPGEQLALTHTPGATSLEIEAL